MKRSEVGDVDNGGAALVVSAAQRSPLASQPAGSGLVSCLAREAAASSLLQVPASTSLNNLAVCQVF